MRNNSKQIKGDNKMDIRKNKLDMVDLINDLKKELDEGNTVKTHVFLDLVLSNGDVLHELENQLNEEV